MKIRQCTIAILVAAAFSSAVQSARADEAAALTNEILTMDANATTQGAGTVTGRIAADFEAFAGSKHNATALVTGLRSGSEITLTQRGYRPATFTPPTRPMGYGNVSTSLSLAQHQLAQQGITNPTPEQLKIALNGGTIRANGTTVTYDGILQMRADGMGWGQIAQQLGTKLGHVVSGIKAQNTKIATLSGTKQTPSSVTPATTRTTATPAHSKASGRSTPGEGKGIVNAAGGATPSVGKGKNDGGVSAAGGKTSAPGRGIVSASGQASGAGTHGAAGSHGAGAGQGVVTATGAGAGGAAAGGPGQGKALGHSK